MSLLRDDFQARISLYTSRQRSYWELEHRGNGEHVVSLPCWCDQQAGRREAVCPRAPVDNALDLQSFHPARQGIPNYSSVHPRNSYQAGQDVSRDEHVEDIVPACGGNKPGQQRPQSRTCGEQGVRAGRLLRGLDPRPHDSSRPRRVPSMRLSCQEPKASHRPMDPVPSIMAVTVDSAFALPFRLL